MRIAHLLWSLGVGGVENLLVDIVNEQVRRVDVCLIIINNLIDPQLIERIAPSVKVIKIERNPGSKNPLPVIKLNLLLHRLSPDIIHCHLDGQSKLIWQRVNMVRTIHNTHSDCKELQRFKKVFCISNAVRDYAESKGYHKGIVIYNGLQTRLVKSLVTVPSNTKQQFRFVCVGRLHPDKGQQLIIEAADELVNQKGILSFSIDLIGDGPNRKALESEVVNRKLDHVIHFDGTKSREWIYSHLCEYDLFIMPSVSEGFGLTLAEAISAKIPVITSELPGPMEIIGGGYLGMHFPAGDCHQLSLIIEDFMKRGRNKSQIDEAYQYVKNNFDIETTALRYIEEYRDIIG